MQDENITDPAMQQDAGNLTPVQEIKEKNGKSGISWIMMSMIFNVILLAGLIIPYVMFFQARKSSGEKEMPVAAKISSGASRVVYLNLLYSRFRRAAHSC